MKKMFTKIFKQKWSSKRRSVFIFLLPAVLTFWGLVAAGPAAAFTTCYTCESINNNHNALLTMLKLYFVSGLQGVTDVTLNPLPQMDLFDHYRTIANINLIATDKNSESAVNTITSNLVSYYLAGIDVKQQEATGLAIFQAEDTSGKPPTLTSYVKALKTTTTNPDTAIMNIETLLGPLQYNETQQRDAQNLLRYLENISPVSDIIRVSAHFIIPYADQTAGTPTTEIQLTTSGGKTVGQKIDELQNMLENDPDYKKYKNAYRSAIAARTMFMGNLIRSYQERLAPSDHTKKSVAATNYESATWRLRDPQAPRSYMQEIKNASPATISREAIFLLAEIHYDLYKIQHQNDQLLALQSLSNLQMGQLGAMMGKSNVDQIAKTIYCWYDKDKNGGTNKDPACKPSSTSSASGTSSASDIEGVLNTLPKTQ